jgi:hypothetical protein
MKITVTPNRKIVNLTNKTPEQAKVEYDSLVFGDYHFLDYSFDGEDNFDGDQMLSYAEGKSLEPIGGNLYMSAEGDVYEFVEGDADDFYGAAGGNTVVTFSADGQDDFYGADEEKSKGGKVKGFFKKIGKGVGKSGKWIGKQAKKFVKFVGKLKPKKGARKLRKTKVKGKDKHVDVIPPVVPITTPSGEKQMAKQNPDGTQTVVPTSDVVKAPNGQAVDKKDLQGAGETVITTNPETGTKEVAKVVEEKDVTTLQTTEGEAVPFKTEDIVEKTEEELKNEGKPQGMSKQAKTLLIVGGSLIALGIITFVIFKLRGNKGKGK